MSTRNVELCLLAFVLMAGLCADGQSPPAARQSIPHLQVGAEFSGFDTDVAKSPAPFEYGVGVYADVKVWGPVGIEAEARTIQFNQYLNVRQDIASGGLRYVLNRGPLAAHRYLPYAKALGGVGSADFPEGTYGEDIPRRHDTFTTVTLGCGVDYQLADHISLRGEYEYQYWFDYGRGEAEAKLGLGTANPNGFSVGAAYRF
jgi:opacity protein-like surface antigen